MSQENVELVRRAWDGFCARDAAEKNSASKLRNREAVSQFGGDSANAVCRLAV